MSHSEIFANPFSLNAVAARSAPQNVPEGPRTDSEQPPVVGRGGLTQGCIKLLPLLHRMEERAGERRCVFIGFPLLGPLPPRSSRGEDGELDAALRPHRAAPNSL